MIYFEGCRSQSPDGAVALPPQAINQMTILDEYS